MAHDVFISYASGDKVVADAVCSQLESVHRIRCWIAPRDITPGASWAESIIDALDSSKIMVLIFSNSANASMQIEREVERAVHKGINIIPLRIENATPTKTLEYFISAPHWLDALSVPLENHIDKLANGVKALLARPGHYGRVGPSVPAAVDVDTTPIEPAKMTATPLPPPAAAGRQPHRSQRTAILVVGALAIAIAAAAASRMLWRNGSVETATPAASGAPIVDAPAFVPKETAPPAPVTPAPAPVTAPPAASPAPTAAPARAAAAPAAVGTAKTALKSNLFIDFNHNLSEGTIVVNIDGQKKWSAPLAPPPPKPGTTAKPSDDDRTLAQALSVPSGNHKVNVTLLRPNGDTRETETIALTTDETVPRTLRIRLSRFKRNLQLTSVVGNPESESEKTKKSEPEKVKKP